jgi:dienelactone hydrolase
VNRNNEHEKMQGGGSMKTKLSVWAAVCFAASVISAGTVSAKIVAADVDYKDGKVVLQGYLAYDDSLKGKLPGVLVFHEWNGLGAYVKTRCEQLAKLGYAAFGADIYGKGVRPMSPEESGKQAGIYRADRKLMRRRALAGLEELKKQKITDASRIAAIGYCFGGGVALELARSGADIAGAVTFHGNLDTPDPADAKRIKAKILALHGADDPYVNGEKVLAFEKEMRDAGVDWQLVLYGGAVHGFSNPANGSDSSKGLAYDEKADKRSWQALQDFLREIFY